MITKRKFLLYLFLFIVVALPYGGFFLVQNWYKKQITMIESASFILIDKQSMQLSLIDYKGSVKKQYEIACGKNFGQKEKRGDMKTPEGIFHISDIQDSSTWKHDFGDGKGEIDGAYGPWFLRIEVPGHSGIGIHGTHKPESIGTRDTEGCIRLLNKDIQDLKENVRRGMLVVITPSENDVITTNN